MSRNIKTHATRWMPFVALLALAVAPANAQTFTKVFTPNTIGPGSVSTITLTITNNTGGAITGMEFTDVLPTVPGDVDIADPANASTSCPDGVVSAPAGGGTIGFSDGRLANGSSCTITVDVTASTPGVHTNGAILLTYNELAGDPPLSSPVDLTVVTTLPGFSKSFSPSSISLGETSTITFTIDNTLNASQVGNLDFTDNLPLGMVVADPSNATTDCISASAPDTTILAVPGTNVIDLDASGSTFFPGFEVLPAGATCTVTVDVMATAIGMLDNLTDDLLADFTSAGRASDTLTVTVTPLAIQKDFTDDPTPPGNSATLEFRIDNFNRNFPATGVAFTDDLTTALAGLTFSSLLSNDCGGSVSGVGTNDVILSGGTVAAEGFCTLRVSLSVPAAAVPGAYTNTTSAVTGTVDGSPVVGNTASATLFVEPVPIVTMEFLEVGTFNPDPIVLPGDDVVLRYTITNTSTTSGATDVALDNELTDGTSGFPSDPTSGFFPFPPSVTLPPVPNPPCGVGSSLAIYAPDTERLGLRLTGGSLATAGMAGDSCTFEVTATIPTDFLPGIYTNFTEEPNATVDGATRTGEAASDTLTVIAAPSLTKSFTDDPVAPGDTVTLEFELNYSANASSDATDITFTDDLATLAPLTGLVVTGLPLTEACDPDGAGGDPGTGTLSEAGGILTFMGGTLSPGESCTFSVSIDVPVAATNGTFTNTTSGVAAMVGGIAATSAASSDNLVVGGMTFSKEFIGNPAFPGKALILRFNLENVSSVDATGVGFSDSLFPVANLEATDPALADDCGGTLTVVTIPGLGSVLTYASGTVAAGMSCTIDVEVTVPLTASDGIFQNNASGLGFTLDTMPPTPGATGPAIDDLIVESDQILLVKEFTDDPVAPGDTVNMRFVLSNLDPDNAASMIGFTDDLSTMFAGAIISSVGQSCGSAIGGVGTDMLSVSGGSLPAGGSCQIDIGVDVPAGVSAGIYTNTTSIVTGEIAGSPVTGDVATDDLEIIQLLTFSKSFDGPTTATGTAILTFTITNPGTEIADSISFSDDLNSVIPGLVATSLPTLPCGASSDIDGIGFLTFTGGSLPPLGGVCSFDVEVLVPSSATAGTFPNVTSELIQNGLQVGDPATADLTIEPPPTFAKVFSPDAILAGGTSTLTFTIDNTASALAASSLAFTDNLPAGVVITTPSVTSSTCGGTLTADAGDPSIELAGGSVAAGASCTIDVDVTSVVNGAHVNTTDALMSTSGNSGTATDTLTVSPAADLSVTKTDNNIELTPGGPVTYMITVTNPGPSADPSVGLADTFASPLSNCTYTSSTTGGATGNTTPGSGDLSETLSMPASSTVTYAITCDIDADATGTLSNTATITPSITDNVPGNNSATDTTALEPETDLVLFKADSPDPVTAGEDLTYTITVTNNGPSDSTGSTVTDVLPAGVTFSSSSDCSEAGGTVTCAIDPLVATDSEMVSFTVTVDPGQTTDLSNTATVTANETDSTSGNNSRTEATTVQAETDLSITKDDSADPVTAGEDLTYTMTVTNNGPSDSTGGTVTDVLPAGVTFSSSADCTEAGGTVTCAIDPLAVSASQMVSFTVTVDPGQTAALSNTASIAANETDSTTGNDSDTEGTTVEVETDLSITKSDSADPVTAGEDLTYTMTVTNNGPSDSTGGTVTDVLPAGVTFSSSSDCTEAGGTVTCAIDPLAATDSEMVSFTVTVDPDRTTDLSNTASIAANETDSTTGNDSDTEATTVEVDADLSITKSDSPDPVVAGEDLTYTMTVTNNGPSDSTGGTVTDVLPAGVTFSSSSDCTEAGGTVTCAIDPLAVTTSEMVSFTVTVDPGQTAALSNTASVAGNETDSDSSNDSATEGTTVEAEADLSITKSDSPDPVTAGEDLTYTMTVTNNGPSDSTGGTVTDVLPAGVTFSSSSDCTEAGGTVTCAIDPLAVTASDMVSFIVTVDSDQTAAIDNTASVAGNETDPTSSNDSATANTSVNVETDLSVTKDDSPDPVTAGEDLTYTVTVTNNGPSDSTGSTVTDVLPAGVTFSSSSDCTEAGGTVTCAIPALTAGDSEMVSFVVTVDADQTTAIDNTASVAANETDSTSGNDSDTENTSIGVETDLSITKDDSPDPVVAGEDLTYTLTITNNGPSDSTGSTVTDVLPAGVSFSSSADCTEAGGTVTCAIPAIASGGSEMVSFIVTVDPDQTDPISNTASVAANETDSTSTNDEATATTTVGSESGLSMTKTGSVDPVTAGESQTYTLEVSNAGPSDAMDIMVFDLLPEEASYSSDTDSCTEPADLTGLRAELDPSEEVPPVTSSASGQAVFVLDTSTNELKFAIHVESIDNISAAHIHSGAAGTNGSVVQFLYAGTPVFDPSSPIAGTIQLSAAEAASLLADPHYVNVHTTDFPGGEIRGQIEVSTQTPLLCSLGTLAAGDSSSFDIVTDVAADTADGSVLRNVAIVMSSSTDPNAESLPAPNGTGMLTGATAEVQTSVATEADLSISKTDSSDPVTAGTSFSYTVTVSNAGPSDAQNVVVTDTLPAGVTLLSTSGCSEDPAGVPTCTLGTIAAGDSAQYTITVMVDSGTSGVLTNTASVTSDTTDPDGTNNSTSEDTTVATTADVMITKTDGVTQATPGETLTYVIVVSNLGPSDDPAVAVTDTFPKDLTCTWTSAAVGGASGNTAAGSGDIGDSLSMPVGSEVTYTATCVIDDDAIGTLINIATAFGSIADPDTSNNSATDDDTALVGEADLAIKKTDNGDTAIPGESLTYITTAGNIGPSAEPAATVTDVFPEGLTCTWTSTVEGGAGGNTPAGSGDINDTLSLPVGGEVTYTAVCMIAPDAVGTLLNVATISGLGDDPDTSNNTETDETLLEPAADLAITKTDGVTAATPGESVTYTLVASNAGPSTDSAATVADVFPADLDCTWTSTAEGGASGNTAAGAGDINDTLSLPPGSSVTYTAECNIDSAATGTLSNTATVTASVDDPDTANNSATDDDTVLGATADLQITKTDGVDEAAAGGSLTYTIVATNAGPSDDPSVTVTDIFPDDLDCTWTSVADGGATGNTPAGSGDISDTLSMPAGSSVTYTADCVIDRFATGTISNTATVAGTIADPNSDNNSATDETELVGEADLEMAKDGPATVTVGEELTYTLTVTNNGPSGVDAVTIEDPTPAGLEFVSATAPCEGGFPCDLGTLAPDDEVLVEVTFEVPFSYDGPSPIVNTATVSGETIDPVPENDSASAETDVTFDEEPPVVTDVETAEGPLAACDTLRSPIRRIEITIEDDLAPIENAELTSSYLVVGAGPDGDFSTVDCDGPSGDDVVVELASLSLVSTPTSATAGLRFLDELAPGLYSLVVCDDIEDAAGNALDGDGDAAPGGNFVLSFFRADPRNQFENGHFDACPESLGTVTLDPWTVVTTPPNTITPGTPGSDDSELSPLSASARVSHSIDDTSSLAQCVEVEAGLAYDLVSRWRFEPPMDAMAQLTQTCEFFDGAACTGASLGTSSFAEVLEDDGGLWNMLTGELVAAAGAVSALCDFSVDPVDADPNFDVYLDGLSLVSDRPPVVIFSDSFESGDTSAWSATVIP